MIHSYVVELQALFDRYLQTHLAVSATFTSDARPAEHAYLEGQVHFADRSSLYFTEYIGVTRNSIIKLMYTYHYQDEANQLLFRYDNAPHKPALSSPHHKHLPDAILEVEPPTLAVVLEEIVSIQAWM